MAAPFDRATRKRAQALLDAALDALGLAERYASRSLSTAQRRRVLHELRVQCRAALRARADRFVASVGFAEGDVPKKPPARKVRLFVAKVKGFLRDAFLAGALALFGPDAAGMKPVPGLHAILGQPGVTAQDEDSLAQSLAAQDTLLDELEQAVSAGERAVGQKLAADVSAYAASLWAAAQEAQRRRALRAGRMEGRRAHFGSDEPCHPCQDAAADGWMDPTYLLPIGQTPCGSHCHCAYEWRFIDPPGAAATMSKLSKAERDKLPESDFGDPKRRLFPIVDQDDVESAAHLIGKAKDKDAVKARVIAIAKRKKFRIPEAWDDRATAEMSAHFATFDLGSPEASASADVVLYPNSLLFEAGDYPDKDFSLSPEELCLAAESFSDPVPVDLEHVPTVLDGSLGELREVRPSEDGQKLFGTVAIPKWLDAVLPEGKRKVSCTWDRETKTLGGLALVVKPRITDAALMSAFAAAKEPAVFKGAHRTGHGAYTIQNVHDMAARAGALCDPDNSSSSRFTSSRERSTIQQIHDHAVKGGARCAIMNDRSVAMYGAENPPHQRRRSMTLKERFLALFGKTETPPDDAAVDGFLTALKAEAANPETETATTPEKPAAPASFADSPEAKAMQAKIEKLERENRVAAIQRDAVVFADAEIAAERSLPSERNDLIADFTQAALDDHENPRKVTFSAADGKAVSGGRIDYLKAKHARRPRTLLTREQLLPDDLPEGARVVFAAETDKEKKPSDERLAKLMSYSELGRHALKQQKAGK